MKVSFLPCLLLQPSRAQMSINLLEPTHLLTLNFTQTFYNKLINNLILELKLFNVTSSLTPTHNLTPILYPDLTFANISLIKILNLDLSLPHILTIPLILLILITLFILRIPGIHPIIYSYKSHCIKRECKQPTQPSFAIWIKMIKYTRWFTNTGTTRHNLVCKYDQILA